MLSTAIHSCLNLVTITAQNYTFNNLKVWEMGPLRCCEGELYKTFSAVKVTFHKGDLFGWKGLVKVTFNSPFLNLKVPISKTFKLGLILCSVFSR